MNWRDPKKELPAQDQKVAVLVEPHKWRGSLQESVMSCEVVFGWAVLHPNGSCRVENDDELGHGNIGWLLWSRSKEEQGWYDRERALAWMPAEEFTLPGWTQ